MDILKIRNPSGVSIEKVIITDLIGKKVKRQICNLNLIDVIALKALLSLGNIELSKYNQFCLEAEKKLVKII